MKKILDKLTKKNLIILGSIFGGAALIAFLLGDLASFVAIATGFTLAFKDKFECKCEEECTECKEDKPTK